MSSDFSKGHGFYLINYTNGSFPDIHYFNPLTNYWMTLEVAQNFPKEFIDLFEDVKPISETEPGKVALSENFLLKLLAVSKVNTQSVKLNDILK